MFIHHLESRRRQFPIETVNEEIDNYELFSYEKKTMSYHHEVEPALAEPLSFFHGAQELMRGLSFFIKDYVQNLDKRYEHLTFSIVQSPLKTTISQTKVSKSDDDGEKNLVFEIILYTGNYKRMVCYFNTIIHELAHALHFLKEGEDCSSHSPSFIEINSKLCQETRKLIFGSYWRRYIDNYYIRNQCFYVSPEQCELCLRRRL